jgi:hypothetical protein
MVNVQVRDVPEAVLAALKQRAVAEGVSLQRFLLDVLFAEASVTTNAVVLAEAAADPHGYPAQAGEAAAELERERAGRDRR